MPMTPEQERIKALFEGDPRANFANYAEVVAKDKPDAAPLGPTTYNDMRKGQAFTSYVSPSPLLTEDAQPNNAYQTAIQNRLGQIQNLGEDATKRALFAAQQKQLSAQQSGPIGSDWAPTGSMNDRRKAVLLAAASQKGMPYSWGGGNASGATQGGSSTRSTTGGPVGFDCSGLVQYAFAQVGIKLPRYNQSQLATGTRRNINQLMPGDLVGSSGHVAIYAGNGMMWESPTFGKSVRLAPVRSGMFGVHINY